MHSEPISPSALCWKPLGGGFTRLEGQKPLLEELHRDSDRTVRAQGWVECGRPGGRALKLVHLRFAGVRRGGVVSTRLSSFEPDFWHLTYRILTRYLISTLDPTNEG